MKHILTLAALVFATACFGQVPDYVPTEGLVAWLSFNNGVLDEGPLNNTATDFGSEGTFDRFGLPDAARNFDAARVELASSDVIAQFKTISQWTRTESSSRQVSFKQNVFNGALQERVIITQNFNGDNCHFGIKESCVAPWNYGNQPFVVSDGEWHHFVGVVLPEETRLYVDGALISTTSIVSDSETCTGGDIIIGSEWSGVDYDFQGDIDDVGLWDRPLDDEEIIELYLAETIVLGCSNSEACNFDADAALDDGSCHFNCQFCHEGTVWDEVLFKCVVANPSDTDFDGCVGMTDLLDLLAVFGTCNEIPWSCGDPVEYQGYDYETVQIGEQCWFAENLRSESYKNGDVIPSDLDDAVWTGGYEGATAAYDLEFYGRLYNWYAVDDQRGLCPDSWHVSTNEDWAALESEIVSQGHLGTEGRALKATYGWLEGGAGTDLYGFSALPGGARHAENGLLYNQGFGGDWWTPSSHHLFLLQNSDMIGEGMTDKHFGFSVRCIRDSE